MVSVCTLILQNECCSNGCLLPCRVSLHSALDWSPVTTMLFIQNWRWPANLISRSPFPLPCLSINYCRLTDLGVWRMCCMTRDPQHWKQQGLSSSFLVPFLSFLAHIQMVPNSVNLSNWRTVPHFPEFRRCGRQECSSRVGPPVGVDTHLLCSSVFWLVFGQVCLCFCVTHFFSFFAATLKLFY